MMQPSPENPLFASCFAEKQQEQQERQQVSDDDSISLFSAQDLADICFPLHGDENEDEDDADVVGLVSSSSSSNLTSNDTVSTSSNSRSMLPIRRYHQRDRWLLRFHELIEFKENYGHCSVPTYWPQNEKLAQWVKRQRYQYKLLVSSGDGSKKNKQVSTLTQERKYQLEDIGFVWDAHDAFWEEHYQDLLSFRQDNGHANVPTPPPAVHQEAYPQLAIWVKCQRRQFKSFCEKGPSASNMTWARIAKLAEVDFSFDPRVWKRNRKSSSPLSSYGLLTKLILAQYLPTSAGGSSTTGGEQQSTTTRTSTCAKISSFSSSVKQQDKTFSTSLSDEDSSPLAGSFGSRYFCAGGDDHHDLHDCFHGNTVATNSYSY